MKTAKQLKEELSTRVSDARYITLKDINVVISRDHDKICETNLYNNFSGSYCELLEIMNDHGMLFKPWTLDQLKNAHNELNEYDSRTSFIAECKRYLNTNDLNKVYDFIEREIH